MQITTAEMSVQSEYAAPVRRRALRIWTNPIFWTGFATAGSAFRDLRFEAAGMAFHPYMLALFLLLFKGLPRIHHFPGRIGRPGGLFLLLFICSLIQGNSFLVQLTKISVMAITFVLVAVSVKSFDDFVAGAFGLGMCAALLCVRGLIRGPSSFGSINPIDGAQKNAFSLYYLPGLVLCLYLVFSELLPIWRKVLLASIIALIFAGIALSKNRSGWLSAGIVVMFVFGTNRRRMRIVVFTAVFAGLALLIADIIAYEEGGYVYERDAANAAQSDALRMELFVRALSIGFQHPLLGVSPTRLTRMLGSIEMISEEGIDCHNLTGYLVGGSGLLTFGAYCLLAWSMLRPPQRFSLKTAPPLAVQSVRILTTLVVVWIVRAQFQEDVLFSSTFNVGLGLCIGFCLINGVYDAPTLSAEQTEIEEQEKAIDFAER